MGYDSDIKIEKSEISRVETLLTNHGFEKISQGSNAFIICTYRKYIDDKCKYFEGVYFHVMKCKKKYYLCGRNSVFCTGYDLKMHNDTLLYLSSKLNRDFVTDKGSNLLFETGTLTYGIENALAFAFFDLHNEFEKMFFYMSKIEPLSDSQIRLNKICCDELNQESFSSNLLLIYTVSILETYFKSTFINILKCINTSDLTKIECATNIPRFAQNQFSNGKIDVYNKIATGYSFQKLENIINTFKNCFGLDINPVLKKNTFLRKTRYEILDEIFNIRHRNVHRLQFEYFSFDKFLKYISVITKSLNDIYHYFCQNYKVRRSESDLIRTSYKANKQMVEKNRNY